MRYPNSPERRPQILLVEDDATLLEVMAEALRREGYCFETARNGDEAIDKAYRLNPEVVLLDIDLPGQSGYLVAAKLKVAKPSPKVLFLTALPRGQSDRVASFLRVDGIMHKPFAVRKLLGTVEALLGMAQAA
jgi:two-component system phosphate regulon response regulator PhoB/two-component system alkaline phosphatase synthesis response regulator PhoP